MAVRGAREPPRGCAASCSWPCPRAAGRPCITRVTVRRERAAGEARARRARRRRPASPVWVTACDSGSPLFHARLWRCTATGRTPRTTPSCSTPSGDRPGSGSGVGKGTTARRAGPPSIAPATTAVRSACSRSPTRAGSWPIPVAGCRTRGPPPSRRRAGGRGRTGTTSTTSSPSTTTASRVPRPTTRRGPRGKGGAGDLAAHGPRQRHVGLRQPAQDGDAIPAAHPRPGSASRGGHGGQGRAEDLAGVWSDRRTVFSAGGPRGAGAAPPRGPSRGLVVARYQDWKAPVAARARARRPCTGSRRSGPHAWCRAGHGAPGGLSTTSRSCPRPTRPTRRRASASSARSA